MLLPLACIDTTAVESGLVCNAVRVVHHRQGCAWCYDERLAGRCLILKLCCCFWVQAALSGWGADFLKSNKESEAQANAAVAAAIEKEKGTTTGRLTWHSNLVRKKRCLPMPFQC